MTQLNDFSPVKVTEEQQETLADISKLFSIVAQALISALPSGPHKSSALRNLLEAKFYASQAVTHVDYGTKSDSPAGYVGLRPLTPLRGASRQIPCGAGE